MAGQRDVSNEQILYLLINLREEEAKRDVYKDIVVNKEACKEIGIFNYKVKETKTGEKRASRLFLINETQDGEEINLIYDENGRFIGWQNEAHREKNEIEVAKDLELDKQRLNQQLEKGIQRNRSEAETANSNSGTAKAGEGRDLASKEHEEQKPEYKNLEVPVTKPENEQVNTLRNYKNEINLEYKTKIRLDEIVNGYYLWEILQYEEKYRGRMPEGLSEASFRSGYLTVLDASELEAVDGKTRKAKKIMAICTRDGNVVELDDTILKAEETLAIDDRKRAEQTALRGRDGKEALRPQNEHQLTKEVSYQIPDASSRFGVAEDWGLQVDINTELKRNGTTPVNGNREEISFWQEPKNAPVIDKQLQRNRYVQKFEAINESASKTKEEREQQEDLREKSSSETLERRAEHFDDLVEKAFEKYKNLGDYYNKTDIAKKVHKYHNQGMDDKKVLDQIGKELHKAEEIEHEFYIHGGSRPH